MKTELSSKAVNFLENLKNKKGNYLKNFSKKINISQKLINDIKMNTGNSEKSIDIYGKYIIDLDVYQLISLKENYKDNIVLDKVAVVRENIDNNGTEKDILTLQLNEKEKTLQLVDKWKDYTLVIYDLHDYYSRNKGIILSEKCKGKKVALVGLGSVGSRIAKELAKLNVNLILFDPDTVDVVNPVRWGVEDSIENMIGLPKVRVFKNIIERILPEPPSIMGMEIDIVEYEDLFINSLIEEKPDLVICSTDTRDSINLVNSLTYRLKIPTLYVLLSNGALTGQIFYVKPDRRDPCFSCLIGNNDSEVLDIRATNKQYGVDISDNSSTGVAALSINISMVSSFAAKIALVLIANGEIEEYFKNFNENDGNTLLWISTSPNEWIFDDFAQKVAVKVEKREDCVLCSSNKN